MSSPHRVHDRATVSEERFLDDVDYDDAAIGEMLFNAYREQVYQSSEKASLLVSRRRPFPKERGDPLWKSGKKPR